MAKSGKDKSSVSLPKAWKSVRKSNDMKQTRNDFKDFGGLIAALFVAGLVAFILLGGISQRGVWEFAKKWSTNVGNKVSSWINSGGVEVTDDGIYINPNANGGNLTDGLIDPNPYANGGNTSNNSNTDSSNNTDDSNNNTNNDTNSGNDANTNDSTS